MASPDLLERDVDPQAQLRYGLSVLRGGWLMVFTLAAVGAIVGFGLFLFLPKQFQSEAKIMLRGRWMLEGASAEISTGSNLPTRVRAQLLEDQVKSTRWIASVLDRLEWTEWARARENDLARRDFVDRVKDRLDITIEKGETGERLVFVKFRWSDRWKARDFVKGIRDQWLSEVFDSHKRDLDREVAIRESQLRKKERDLNTSRRELELFETRNGISQLSPYESYQERADELQSELDSIELQILSLQKQEDQWDQLLTERGENGELLVPPNLLEQDVVANDQVEAQLKRIEELSAELSRLRTEKDYTERHPAVQSAMLKLAQAMITLSEDPIPDVQSFSESSEANPEFTRIQQRLQETRAQLEGLLAQQQTVLAKLNRTQNILDTLPPRLRQMQEMLFEINRHQTLVSVAEMDLAPLADMQEALTRQGPQVLPYTTLEEPTAPTKPKSSLGFLALGGCIFAGLGIAIVWIAGKEILKTSFTTAEQARRALKLPVLGEVAPIRTDAERRRQRFGRLLQVAASMVLLAGLVATVYVCSTQPELLPVWLVDRAAEIREGLV